MSATPDAAMAAWVAYAVAELSDIDSKAQQRLQREWSLTSVGIRAGSCQVVSLDYFRHKKSTATTTYQKRPAGVVIKFGALDAQY